MPTLEAVADVRAELDVIRDTLNESWKVCGHKVGVALASYALRDLERMEAQRWLHPGRPGPIPESSIADEISQIRRAIVWSLTPVLTRKSTVDPLEHGRACPFPIPAPTR